MNKQKSYQFCYDVVASLSPPMSKIVEGNLNMLWRVQFSISYHIAVEAFSSEAPSVKIATSAVIAEQREEEERGATKGGGDATKGRGDQPRQGDKLAGKTVGTRLVSVLAEFCRSGHKNWMGS